MKIFVCFILFFNCTLLRAEQRALRVVSLCPSTSQIMIELGAEESLIAVTSYCPNPQEVPLIGNLMHIDLEAIYALKPDLILGLEQINSGAQVQKLKSLGLNLQLLPEQKSWKDIVQALQSVGELLGRSAETEQLIEHAKHKRQNLLATAKQLRSLNVLFVLDPEQMITAGKHSYLNEMIESLNQRNVFGQLEQAYPKVSWQEAIIRKPDVVLALLDGPRYEQYLEHWKGLGQKVPAFLKPQVMRINPSLISVPTVGNYLKALSLIFERVQQIVIL